MKKSMSADQIGIRIAELRKRKGYSQEDLGKFLNIPRSSIAQIELGNRTIAVLELVKLSEKLGFSLDEFLSADYLKEPAFKVEAELKPQKKEMRISIPKMKIDKFKNILLYVLERCSGKPNVGETVLYKLLYFADFNYYELYEDHLSGARYKKLPYGPVPQKLESIIESMIDNEELRRIKTKFHGYPQTRYIPLEKPDLTKFNGAEKEVIDQVIDRYSDWSASAISTYSHKDMPWKATEEGRFIEYELAFYRDTPYSARTYDDDIEMP
ncbi:MAG: DUF4065 domain-containing protein [Acidimicrobiia bacterium]|nr:DUF4065 domain-containing protein [Acidimicrobiia bacterium]